jgi:hypothetical protein
MVTERINKVHISCLNNIMLVCLKVHNIENVLAPNLNFVLFHC